jgi:hypothetical protein
MNVNSTRLRLAVVTALLAIGSLLVYRVYQIEAQASYDAQQARFDR